MDSAEIEWHPFVEFLFGVAEWFEMVVGLKEENDRKRSRFYANQHVLKEQ